MIPHHAAFGIQERVNGPVKEQAHQGGGIGSISNGLRMNGAISGQGATSS
jgi:hypothetical protein